MRAPTSKDGVVHSANGILCHTDGIKWQPPQLGPDQVFSIEHIRRLEQDQLGLILVVQAPPRAVPSECYRADSVVHTSCIVSASTFCRKKHGMVMMARFGDWCLRIGNSYHLALAVVNGCGGCLASLVHSPWSVDTDTRVLKRNTDR